MQLIDAMTYQLIGEGASKEEAIQDALSNAYWSDDNNQLITREAIEDELSNYIASDGEKGFFFRDDDQ